MNHTKITGSSNIYSIGYDPQTHVMEICFHSKALYRYENIVPNIWTGFMCADSKGKFLAANIKPAYQGILVTQKVTAEFIQQVEHLTALHEQMQGRTHRTGGKQEVVELKLLADVDKHIVETLEQKKNIGIGIIPEERLKKNE